MRKIKCLGSFNGHQSGNIYSPWGLCPCLEATFPFHPIRIVIGIGKEDNLKVSRRNDESNGSED